MASKARSAIDEVAHEARQLASACIIKTGLAGLYREVVDEPLPLRFVNLLNMLSGDSTNGRSVSVSAAHLDPACGCGNDLRLGLRPGDMAQREEE